MGVLPRLGRAVQNWRRGIISITGASNCGSADIGNSPRQAFAQLAAPSAKAMIPEIVRRKSKAAKDRSFTKVAAAHQAETAPSPAGW